jgi:hypothetical protein
MAALSREVTVTVPQDFREALEDMQRSSKRIGRLTRSLGQELAAFKDAADRLGIEVQLNITTKSGVESLDHPRPHSGKDAQ